MKQMKSCFAFIVALVKGIDNFISKLEQWSICIILVEMILLAFLQVILRNLFSMGYSWIDELLRISVLWIGLLGASIAIRQGRHINIDVVSNIIPKQYKRFLNIILDTVLLLVCILFFMASYNFIMGERQFGGVSSLFSIPMWVLELIFPLLFGLGIFRFCIKISYDLKNIIKVQEK